MKQVLDYQYAKLCQELGDLESKIFIFKKRSEEIKNKILSLNEMQPELVHLQAVMPKENTSDRNKA
jgi:hypothetical protein